MSQELLYTSAPRGLKPGSRGFCTVLTTRGMTTWLVERLESLSGYRHVFLPNDPQTDKNPVLWSHLRVPAGGKQYDVLSRVGAYGLDYSSRTNKLAHHVVVESGEQTEAGPAWLLSNPGALQSDWDGEVQALPHGRSLPQGSLACTVCQTWARLTGDAGWAGVVAESFLADPHRLVYLVFEPGQDLLPLLVEVQSLLPPAVRWQVTFSTYYTGLPQDIPCVWRCVLKGSEEARMARRFPQSLQIDLTTPLQTAAGGALVEAARTGILPVAAAVVTVDQSIDPEEPQVESPELPVAAKKQAAKPGEYGLQGEFAVEGGPPPIQPALRRQEKTKQRRREKRLWGGLASAAILLVAVTTYFWWNSRGGGTAGNPRLVAQQEVSGKASRPKRQKPRPETPAADVSDQTEDQDASPKDGTPLPVGQAMASAGNGGTPPKDGAGDGRETEMLVGVALKTPENVEKSKTKPPDAVPGKSTPPQNVPPKQNPETKPDEASAPKGEEQPKSTEPSAKPTPSPAPNVPEKGIKTPDFYVQLPGVDDKTDVKLMNLNVEPESVKLAILLPGDQECQINRSARGKKDDPFSWNIKTSNENRSSGAAAVTNLIWGTLTLKKTSSVGGGHPLEFGWGKADIMKDLHAKLRTGILILGDGSNSHAIALQRPVVMIPREGRILLTGAVSNRGNQVFAITENLELHPKDIKLNLDGIEYSDWETSDNANYSSKTLVEYCKADSEDAFRHQVNSALADQNIEAALRKMIIDEYIKSHKTHCKLQNFKPALKIDKQHERWNLEFIVDKSVLKNLTSLKKILFSKEIGIITRLAKAEKNKGNQLAQANIQKLIAELKNPLQQYVTLQLAERFKSQATIISGRIVTQVGPYEVDVVRIGTEEPASPLKPSEPEAGK